MTKLVQNVLYLLIVLSLNNCYLACTLGKVDVIIIVCAWHCTTVASYVLGSHLGLDLFLFPLKIIITITIKCMAQKKA